MCASHRQSLLIFTLLAVGLSSPILTSACSPWGSIELRDGSSVSNGPGGQVVMCVGGNWRVICDVEWSNEDASVVCGQVGYSKQGAIGIHGGSRTNYYVRYRVDVRCRGTESSLISCPRQSYSNGCEPAAVTCQRLEPLTLRLVTKNERISNYSTAGRVEVYHNEKWGSICSDGIDSTDARVICRRLFGRYTDVLRYGKVGSEGLEFDQGPSSSPVWLDGLQCGPDHPYQRTCPHDDYGATNCNHTKDVAIACLVAGSMRLNASTLNYGSPVGLLEIYSGRYWGTVCEDGFDQMDADVVCEQMGYSRAYKYGNVDTLGYKYGGFKTIWPSDILCISSIVHRTECNPARFYTTERSRCSHNQDLAIECISRLTLRLVVKDGTAPYLVAGRVEVSHNGQWGTICSAGFTLADARVICVMLTGSSTVLGYGPVGSDMLGFDQGPSSSPVLLENLRCTLRNSYRFCSHDGFGNTNCSHDKDIAVSCQADGAVRLVKNGSSFAGGSSGVVEIYMGGWWGAVCLTNGFTQTAADIVCRQLGYERALEYGSADDLGYSYDRRLDYYSYQIQGRSLRCSPNDLLLTNCSYTRTSFCSSGNEVAVTCQLTASGDSSVGRVSGSISAILVIVILCAIAAFIVLIICYKKRVRAPQHLSSDGGHVMSTLPVHSASSTTNIGNGSRDGGHVMSTLPVHSASSTTNVGNWNPTHSTQPTNQTFSYSGQPLQVLTESSPHLKAETHADEAPPAYHTAATYQTVAHDYHKATQSAASSKEAIDPRPSAPPAYSTVAGGNDYTVYKS